MLHFRLLLFNPAHSGLRWSLMQPASQLIQLAGRAHRIGLHPAVIQVASPARHADGMCVFLDEPAESDALHRARDQPAPRRLPFFQWICSGGASAAMPNGVDSSAFFTAAHKSCS